MNLHSAIPVLTVMNFHHGFLWALCSFGRRRCAVAGFLASITRKLVQFAPEQVKPRHVAQLKVDLAETPNMGNRCLSVLRQVFDYALERQLVESNPAVGIRRHKEAKRTRLLSMQEYGAIYAKAGPRLQVIMDLCIRTGERISDVLRMRRADLTEEGIRFVQMKTGANASCRGHRSCGLWWTEPSACTGTSKRSRCYTTGEAKRLTTPR